MRVEKECEQRRSASKEKESGERETVEMCEYRKSE